MWLLLVFVLGACDALRNLRRCVWLLLVFVLGACDALGNVRRRVWLLLVFVLGAGLASCQRCHDVRSELRRQSPLSAEELRGAQGVDCTLTRTCRAPLVCADSRNIAHVVISSTCQLPCSDGTECPAPFECVWTDHGPRVAGSQGVCDERDAPSP